MAGGPGPAAARPSRMELRVGATAEGGGRAGGAATGSSGVVNRDGMLASRPERLRAAPAGRCSLILGDTPALPGRANKGKRVSFKLGMPLHS